MIIVRTNAAAKRLPPKLNIGEHGEAELKLLPSTPGGRKMFPQADFVEYAVGLITTAGSSVGLSIIANILYERYFKAGNIKTQSDKTVVINLPDGTRIEVFSRE